jgi:PAS domain S-box-containing protein
VGVGATGLAVAEDRTVIAADDARSQFPASEVNDLFFDRTGFTSMIIAPISSETGPLGAIEVYANRPNAFDEADAALIRSLADQAAIAIQNARLIEELARSREETARRADAERTLREITASISAIREPDVVLQQTINEARRLLRADAGIIDLLDPDTSTLHWAYDTGDFNEGDRERFSTTEIELGKGIAGRAVLERRVIRSGDYQTHQYDHTATGDDFAAEQDIRSVIAAPIIGESGPVGAIEVYSHHPDAFDDLDAAVLGGLADQAAVTIQNARLIEALDRSAEEIRRRADAERALRQIAANISAIRNPAVILQQTVDEAKRLLSSTDARIDLLEDGRRLRWAYTSEQSDLKLLEAMDATFDVGEGVAGLVVSQGRPFRTGDYLGDGRFPHTEASDEFVRAAGLMSALAVPLTGESGVLGAISVATSRRDAYDDGDAELLTALADQAAIAIQNARLIEELEQSQTALAHRVDTERSLREMAARIAELRDPDELLRRIVDETRRLLGSDGAHLTRMREEGDVLVPVVVAGGLDTETAEWLMTLEFPVMSGINGMAAGLGEAVWTADYKSDPRIPHDPEDDAAAERLGLCSLASVPLRSPEGGIIGTLAVSYREQHPFDEDELGLLKGLADHAAIALTNTSLYERLRESERRYRHLVQNSPDLVWSIDAEARLSFVSDTSERLTGWKPEELLGQHFGAIVHPSSHQIAEIDWTRGMRMPQQELRGRLNLLHRDGHAIPAEFTAMGTLDEEGNFAGANGSVRDIADRDRMERDLRRQAAELASGEERAHLARELHDSVTQALFSMTLLARTVEMLLDRDPDKAREQLAALRELQREALAEMRALIFELRPGNLEQDGLYKALRTHTAALQGRIGLPIVVNSELDGRLPVAVEEVLYRIAQEALHNVVKHAGAREVRLELGRDGDEVRLRVADDGKGFDPGSVPDGHLGLTGMRARAEKIGARLTVRSAPGAGTAIEVKVPSSVVEEARRVAADLRRLEVAASAE